MAERSTPGNLMRSEDVSVPGPQPQTRNELQSWVRDHLSLSSTIETSLLNAIDAVFSRHERLWQESKHEAIQALSAGFADKMARVQTELLAKDATVSSISRYFEALVADLTDKSHRDPKTKLINFGRFTEQLESFLALEQRGRWCAVGLVDITGFKWYNDALGHAVGDRIIERVASLLREQVRSDDLLAQERLGPRSKDLHARFGGDEFCFLIPDLAECHQAHAVGERFREAVERLRLDARGSPPRGAAGPRRRRRRLPLAGTRGGAALHRAASGGRPHSARRQTDVRSQERARQSHLPGALPHRERHRRRRS